MKGLTLWERIKEWWAPHRLIQCSASRPAHGGVHYCVRHKGHWGLHADFEGTQFAAHGGDSK